MININRDDLKNYKRIGSGMFATVYTDYNYSYKIYHRLCLDYSQDSSFFKNPSLVYRPIKMKKLMKLDNKIINTDLVKDIINVDGVFGGVLLPYYEGETLTHFLDEPFEIKKDICKQIIINFKELVDHYIYATDVALRNILYSNGEVKIIDLDDVFTKVSLIPNRCYYSKTMRGIDSTIKTFLGEVEHINGRHFLGDEVEKYLLRKREKVEVKASYEDIVNYLNRKNEYNNYLLLCGDSDIDVIQEFKNKGYRIILIKDSKCSNDDKEYILKEIIKYYESGIDLYDVVDEKNIDRYLNNDAVDTALELHNKSLVKKNYR